MPQLTATSAIISHKKVVGPPFPARLLLQMALVLVRLPVRSTDRTSTPLIFAFTFADTLRSISALYFAYLASWTKNTLT